MVIKHLHVSVLSSGCKIRRCMTSIVYDNKKMLSGKMFFYNKLLTVRLHCSVG